MHADRRVSLQNAGLIPETGIVPSEHPLPYASGFRYCLYVVYCSCLASIAALSLCAGVSAPSGLASPLTRQIVTHPETSSIPVPPPSLSAPPFLPLDAPLPQPVSTSYRVPHFQTRGICTPFWGLAPLLLRFRCASLLYHGHASHCFSGLSAIFMRIFVQFKMGCKWPHFRKTFFSLEKLHHFPAYCQKLGISAWHSQC